MELILALGDQGSLPFNQKIRKLLNFRQANHLTKNFGNPERKTNGVEILCNKISENFGKPPKVILFSGNYREGGFVRHWKFSKVRKEWKAS